MQQQVAFYLTEILVWNLIIWAAAYTREITIFQKKIYTKQSQQKVEQTSCTGNKGLSNIIYLIYNH